MPTKMQEDRETAQLWRNLLIEKFNPYLRKIGYRMDWFQNVDDPHGFSLAIMGIEVVREVKTSPPVFGSKQSVFRFFPVDARFATTPEGKRRPGGAFYVKFPMRIMAGKERTKKVIREAALEYMRRYNQAFLIVHFGKDKNLKSLAFFSRQQDDCSYLRDSQWGVGEPPYNENRIQNVRLSGGWVGIVGRPPDEVLLQIVKEFEERKKVIQ
jgi:hypothetical protein